MAVVVIGVADLVRSATVAVYDGDTFRGSGFYVAPGRVLTCAHVMHGATRPSLSTANGRVEIESVIAEPREESPDGRFAAPDTAVLTVADTRHPCVPLADGPPADKVKLDVLGYSDLRVGTLETDWATVDLVGVVADPGLYKLAAGQIKDGLSGAPLVDRRGVVGMVKSSLNYDEPWGGYAVPIEAVLAVSTDEDLAAANHAVFDEPFAALRAMQSGLGQLPDELRALLPPAAVATLLDLLDGTGPAPVLLPDDRAEWVARTLLTRSLDDLRPLLRKARAALGDRLGDVLDILACCLPARRDKPAAWIPVDAATALRQEWAEDAPRVARLGSDDADTLRYLMRRAGHQDTEVMGGMPASAEVGTSGVALERFADIDSWFCRRGGYTPEEWSDAARDDLLRWEWIREPAYRLDGGALADGAELAQLRRLFSGLKFLVATRAHEMPPCAEREVLDLAPPVERQIERVVLQILAEFAGAVG